jgi:hypothetical protein
VQNDEPFRFLHCVTMLRQLPNFDPMGTDDVAIDLLDDEELVEKKPGATNGKQTRLASLCELT